MTRAQERAAVVAATAFVIYASISVALGIDTALLVVQKTIPGILMSIVLLLIMGGEEKNDRT